MATTHAPPSPTPFGADDLLATPRRVLRAFDRLLTGRFWIVVVVGLATAISLFTAFPTYDKFEPGSKDWKAIERLSEHPFDQKGLDANKDRAYNFTFRAAVPLAGRALGLGPWGYLVLQGMAGLGMFAAAAHLVDRLTRNRRLGALVAIAIGLMWAGSGAFVELRGNFDAVAIALLVAAMATRRVPLVVLCTFLAGWTDERALPAIAFVVLFHHVVESRELGVAKALREPRCLAAAAGLALHVVTRVIVSVAMDVHQPSNLGLEYVKAQLSILPVGAWTGLEGFWLFVLVGAVALWKVRQRFLALAYAGLVAVVCVGSIAVVDVTRSMAYLLPAALAGLGLIHRLCQPKVLRASIYAAVALTAAWPVYYAGGAFTLYWQYPLPLVIVRRLAGIG